MYCKHGNRDGARLFISALNPLGRRISRLGTACQPKSVVTPYL